MAHMLWAVTPPGTIYVFIQLIFISPVCRREYHHFYFIDEETEVLRGPLSSEG